MRRCAGYLEFSSKWFISNKFLWQRPENDVDFGCNVYDVNTFVKLNCNKWRGLRKGRVLFERWFKLFNFTTWSQVMNNVINYKVVVLFTGGFVAGVFMGGFELGLGTVRWGKGVFDILGEVGWGEGADAPWLKGVTLPVLVPVTVFAGGPAITLLRCSLACVNCNFSWYNPCLAFST